MGCKNATPPPPDEPSIDVKRKLEDLRGLWSPLSIWTGTIEISGKQTPWEVHVKRDSTSHEIKAKRLTNFARSLYTDAYSVGFDYTWEEELAENGKHLGYKDIIYFEWEDADYKLYADTLDGIIDVPERRVRGLVVENKTGKTGRVDFCRVMSKKTNKDTEVIHTVSLDLEIDNERSNRVNEHLAVANKAADDDERRFTAYAENPV